ncbi:hypothetical protein [Sorangium sp. So ce117]|uniref:hypothetical protein n=1 Tax=Sorangium sp. So ce117 TaxID=3133277 RepID=UPI003F5E4149
MEPKMITKQRGIRMAMQIAALSVGAGAATMALVASEASAGGVTDAAAAGAAARLPSDAQAAASQEPAIGPEPVRVTGWSCWTPISRGPLAPPVQPDEEFEALLAEVPA